MTPPRPRLSAVALFFVALLGAASAAAQSDGPRRLTPGDMRLTAATSLDEGRAARALALAEALMLRDPDDPVALHIAARGALQVGRADKTLRYAKRLFRESRTDGERFVAARMAALALASEEKFTRAQIWLRRARQLAPDDRARAAVGRDYRILRARNPLRFQFDVGVSPSSNINNGSSEDGFEFLGVPVGFTPDARALAGVEVSFSGRVEYKLHQTQRHLTSLSASGSLSRYALSPESAETAPDFDTAELDRSRVDVDLKHQWATSGQDAPAHVALGLAFTRHGGAAYARELSLSGGRSWQLSDAALVHADLDLARTTYLQSDTTSRAWDAALRWSRDLDDGRRLHLFTGAGETLSDSVSLRSERRHVGVGYDLGRVADRVDVAMGVSHVWRDYAPSLLTPEGRHDRQVRASVTLGMPMVEVYGFQPQTQFEFRDTASNAARYETQSISVDFGFRSAF